MIVLGLGLGLVLRLGLRLGFVSVKINVEVRLGAGCLSFVHLSYLTFILQFVRIFLAERFKPLPSSEDSAWIFLGEFLRIFPVLPSSFQFYHALTRL